MTYRNGPFHVEMAADGAIRVRPRDWLSKYSAAIHNDFWHVHEYARQGPNGRVQPVANLNLIYAGETLYHLPTYYGSLGSSTITVPSKAPALTDAQKKQLVLETLKREYHLRGDHLPWLSKAIDVVGYADNALTMAEIAGLMAEGTVAATAASAFAIASAFLFPIGGAIQILNAWEFGERQTGLRAVAYATTAWSFGDAVPRLPSRLQHNVATSRGAPVVARYVKAWDEAARSAVISLEKTVRERRIQKRSLQALYIALGDKNRKQLARTLMEEMAKQFRPGMERDAFLSPRPDYPN